MVWGFKGLRSLIDQEATRPSPAYIVPHVGANNIVELSSYSWKAELEVAVAYLRLIHPQSRLVWSDMLPRQEWRGTPYQEAAEKARIRCQQRARAIIRREGGAVIHHADLAKGQHLSADNVHLTEKGQQIFRRELEEGILLIMNKFKYEEWFGPVELMDQPSAPRWSKWGKAGGPSPNGYSWRGPSPCVRILV